jgi:hypothetical protein
LLWLVPCHLEFLLFWYFLCSWQMVGLVIISYTWMLFISWFFMNNYKKYITYNLIEHDAYN